MAWRNAMNLSTRPLGRAGRRERAGYHAAPPRARDVAAAPAGEACEYAVAVDAAEAYDPTRDEWRFVAPVHGGACATGRRR